MFRSTLVPLFAIACLTLSTSTASAQNLLNPFTWFGPQTGYGNSYANCPNGQCNVPGNYYGGLNCANGQCNLPPNCANGICPTPVSRYNTQPYYGNAPYVAPRQNVPSQYLPYSAQRPVNRTPYYDRSVTPAGSFDWDAPTTANNRRGYSPSNSPFYP